MYYVITQPSKAFDFVGITKSEWIKIDKSNIKFIQARISGIEKAIIYMNNYFLKTGGLHQEKCNDFTKKLLAQRFGNRYYSFYEGKIKAVKKQENVFTYIVYDKFSELYKIGRSVDVDKRIASLKTANPNIEFVVKYNRDIEKELHSDYSHKRVEREWFSLTLEDLREIHKYYKFERKPKIKNTIKQEIEKTKKKSKSKYYDKNSVEAIRKKLEASYKKRMNIKNNSSN